MTMKEAQQVYDNLSDEYDDGAVTEDMIDFSPLFDAVGGDENLVESLKMTYLDAVNLTVKNINEYLINDFHEAKVANKLTEDNIEVEVDNYITNTLIDLGV